MYTPLLLGSQINYNNTFTLLKFQSEQGVFDVFTAFFNTKTQK